MEKDNMVLEKSFNYLSLYKNIYIHIHTIHKTHPCVFKLVIHDIRKDLDANVKFIVPDDENIVIIIKM